MAKKEKQLEFPPELGTDPDPIFTPEEEAEHERLLKELEEAEDAEVGQVIDILVEEIAETAEAPEAEAAASAPAPAPAYIPGFVEAASIVPGPSTSRMRCLFCGTEIVTESDASARLTQHLGSRHSSELLAAPSRDLNSFFEAVPLEAV